jgi:hypothetical protein
VTFSMPMDDEHTADVVQVVAHLRPPPTAHHRPAESRQSTRACRCRTTHARSRRPHGDGQHLLPRALSSPSTWTPASTPWNPCSWSHVLHAEGCAVSAVVEPLPAPPCRLGARRRELRRERATLPPKEVSSLHLDARFLPRWISVDPASDHIVVSSSEGATHVS